MLLLGCAGGLWLFRPPSAPLAHVTILPSHYTIVSPSTPVPDRWIPRTWGWLWKMRYAILGKPITVIIETRVMHFREADTLKLQQLLEDPAPLASSNGVRAWILPDAEMKPLALRMERRVRENRLGRMSLGPGVLATMSMSTSRLIHNLPSPVGDTISYTVRQRGNSVDLTGAFLSTEVMTNTSNDAEDSRAILSLHTNLALAVRMQIPRGQSVFLYDTNRALAPNSGVGLLIFPKIQ